MKTFKFGELIEKIEELIALIDDELDTDTSFREIQKERQAQFIQDVYDFAELKNAEGKVIDFHTVDDDEDVDEEDFIEAHRDWIKDGLIRALSDLADCGR